MKRRIFSIIGLSLFLLPLSVNALPENHQTDRFSSSTTVAQHFARGKSKGMGRGFDRMLQQLDLTAEQSAQIDTIKEKARQEREALHEEMTADRQEMKSLFVSDASAETLREKHQKMQNWHQQLGTNKFETMLEIREVLTLEQREKMATLIEDRMERRRGKN